MAKAIADAMTSALKAVNKMGNYVARGFGCIGKTVDDAAAASKSMGIDTFTRTASDGKLEIKSKTTGKSIKYDDLFDPNKPPDSCLTRLADILDEAEMKTVQDAVTGSGKQIDELVDSVRQSDAYKASAKKKSAAESKYGKLETADQQTKFNNDVKKLVVKVGLLAGVTYALCSGLAAKMNGCYLKHTNNDERVTKVSGGKSTCSCGKMAYDAQSNSAYADHAFECERYCEAVKDPEGGAQTDWTQCDVSCSCKTKEGKLSPEQYEFEWVEMNAWDMFTSILADAGYFVADVVEAGIDIAQQALSSVGKMLKYWWIILIVVVVAIALGVGLKFGLNGKNKSSVKGGRIRGGYTPMVEFYPVF